jgi:hypothetical protein
VKIPAGGAHYEDLQGSAVSLRHSILLDLSGFLSIGGSAPTIVAPKEPADPVFLLSANKNIPGIKKFSPRCFSFDSVSFRI